MSTNFSTASCSKTTPLITFDNNNINFTSSNSQLFMSKHCSKTTSNNENSLTPLNTIIYQMPQGVVYANMDGILFFGKKIFLQNLLHLFNFSNFL